MSTLRTSLFTLGYGVMVTLQILVLSFLVRIRVPQRMVVRLHLADRDCGKCNKGVFDSPFPILTRGMDKLRLKFLLGDGRVV